jgi:hypothetical protein
MSAYDDLDGDYVDGVFRTSADIQFMAAGDYEGAEDDVADWAEENGVDVDEALAAYHAGDSSFFDADDDPSVVGVAMSDCVTCGHRFDPDGYHGDPDHCPDCSTLF